MRSVAPVGDEHMAGSLKCVDLARYLFKRLLGIILHRGERAADYSFNRPFRSLIVLLWGEWLRLHSS